LTSTSPITIKKTVTVAAPATIANFVCGFDILGMALDNPTDFMEVSLCEEPGIFIEHKDDYRLPLDPEKNVAGAALLSMLKEYKSPLGIKLIIDKQIKPSSGLGSSAASSAGAVVAVNHLLDNYFCNNDLVRFAMAGEKVASGVKHADNIGPCIYGGITLIRSIFPLDIVPIPAPDLFVSVIHPQIEIKTSDSRQILRKQVLLKDAILQWGNISGLIMGLVKNDHALISRSMHDVIIEPVRSILIPGFKEIKNACLEIGALGGGIAGSGPSIFMLSAKKNTALEVEAQMKNIYDRIGVAYKTYVTNISNQGVRIINVR
jgi:homoserine kinase